MQVKGWVNLGFGIQAFTGKWKENGRKGRGEKLGEGARKWEIRHRKKEEGEKLVGVVVG